MSKLVVLSLGQGNLHDGFGGVTAQLWENDSPQPLKFQGSLPAAPALAELYRSWQLLYWALHRRLDWSPRLEIDASHVTNVSEVDFERLCQQLSDKINTWLNSELFRPIDQQLRTHLNSSNEIRLIIETHDEWLWRLPWHQWDWFQDYPKAEIALSRPEYKRCQTLQLDIHRDKIRILAILGNSQGIDLAAEAEFLKSLRDAEVTFLVNPSRQEFNTQLWNKLGWDIFFFAGHSQTEGRTGRLYINENPVNNSITIQQLEEALKAAIEHGLKLAIFNSCDGLGLALALERLYIPVVVAMREPVPNQVAQEFFKYFLEAFAIEHLSFYQAIRQARRKLQGLEDDFPGASWLPMVCQNPAIEPPTWLQLDGIPSGQVRQEKGLTNRLIQATRGIQETLPQSDATAADTAQVNLQQPPFVTSEQYSRVEEVLTDLVGPIASTLIQSFGAQARSPKELVEKLAVYLPPLQVTEFEKQVKALLQEPSGSLKTPVDIPVAANHQAITDAFVSECERSLTELIGPIAVLLVQNTLAASPQISQAELVKTLAAEIPNPQKAAEFKQHFED